MATLGCVKGGATLTGFSSLGEALPVIAYGVIGMSRQRLVKTRRICSVSAVGADATDHTGADATDHTHSTLQGELVSQGRLEARRCGVAGEDIKDFLAEYLLGCHLSPDPKNQALTYVCGANRARTFMRKERHWKQRVILAETAQIQWLVNSGKGVEVGKSPNKEVLNRLTPEGIVLLQDLQNRLLTAMSELTELQQKVLYLRLVEDLSFAEVAAQTGQSSVAARMSLRSGQRRLGALLESSDFPCGEACEYLSLLNRPELS